MRRTVLEFWKRKGLFGRGSNTRHEENGSAGPHPTPGPPHLPKRRLLLERLEERLLFDAGPQAPSDIDMEMANEQSMQSSAIADVLDARLIEPAETRPAMTTTAAASTGASELEQSLAAQAVEHSAVPALDPNAVAQPTVGSPLNADAVVLELLTTADEQRTELRAATTHLRHEIVFVDPTIRNLPELLAGLSPEAEVVLFDSTRDGIEQIAERLAGRTGLDAIHILSHGSDATAQLGTATLNIDTIQGQYAEALQRIGQSLAAGGDLLMYGCNFGAGAEGRLATEALARVTGADVATSSDATGHSERGGDWELEQQVGVIEASVIVSLSTQVEWVGLLPTTIARTSTSVFYMDAGDSLDSAYASYRITNSNGVNYSDVWVTIGSFTGGVVSANANEDRVMHLGTLTDGQTKAAFFYLTATGITTVDQGHTINVYSGLPSGGNLISSQAFVFTDVVSTIAANANKVTTVVSGPNPAELGGIMTITVTGETGTIGAAKVMAFTPATYSTWRADAFELIGTTITLSAPNAGTFTDTLLIPPASLPSSASTPYQNVYTFRAVGITTAPTIVSPVGYISSGTQVKHTGTGNFLNGTFPPIQTPQNTTTLSKLSNIDSLHGGGNVSYTLRLTNSGATAITVDQLIDTLPASVNYVVGSSTFNGSPIGNPTISGQQLTWAGTFAVAAGSTADLVFTATLPDITGVYVNQAIALIGSTQIDTTLNTTDNAPATKSVAIGNEVPVAVDDSYAFTEDQTININIPGVKTNDSDADGDALTVTLLTGPANGLLTLNADGSFSFTPDANFAGSETFTYQIADGYGGFDSATVTLIGMEVNDPPAGTDASRNIPEDTTYVFASTDFGFSDPLDVPDNAFLEIVIATLPPPADGVLFLSGVHVTLGQVIPLTEIGNLTFTPTLNLNGSGLAPFTFQVVDNAGGNNTDLTPNSFHFNITAVNDPPTSSDQTVTTAEDSNYVFTLLDFPYSDVEGDALDEIRIDSLPSAGTLIFNGNPVVAGQLISPTDITAGLLQYQPPPDLYGSPSTTFTFSVSDGAICSTTPATMTVNVTPVADITADSLSTNEDTPLSFNPITGTNGATADTFEATGPTITAINGTAIAVGGSVTVTDGLVSLAAGNVLTFTPNANFNGSVPPFSYTVSSGGTTETANINITVSPINDPPVADDETFLVDINGSVIIPVLLGDTDLDGDTLSVTEIDGTPLSIGSPVTIATGLVSLNADGTLTFAPNANFTGPSSFNYTVSDGNGGTDIGNVNGSVGTFNDPPVADDETFTVAEDGSVIIPVLTGDIDVDGDTLTVTHIDGTAISVGSPVMIATGIVSLNADGTLTFTPNANFNGPASFDYTVSDGNGGTDIGNVSGTVTPVNDAPTGGDDTKTTPEDTEFVFSTSDFPFNDTESDPLAEVRIDSLPADGTLLLNSNPVTAGDVISAADIAAGLLVFRPDVDENGSPYTSFNFSVGDGMDFVTSSSTMTLNVTPTVVSIAKSYFDSSAPTTLGSNLTIGETVTFALLVTLSEGNTSDLIVVDELPDGLQYVGLTLISTAAGSGGMLMADFAGTFPVPVTTGGMLDGEDVTFTFGAINVTADGDSTNNSFVILVQALVTDVPSNSGLVSSSTTLTNAATADVSNLTPPTSSSTDVTLVEPQIAITKTASIATGDAGDIVTYTLTIQHTSESTGVAHDIVISDLLADTDLLLVAGSVDASLGSVAGIVSIGNNSGDTTVSVDVSQLALGETVIVSFQVIVQTTAVMDESADNSATADWDSLGGPNGRTGSDSDDASVEIAVPTITKTLVSTGIISATNSLTEATIGEFVQYELVITLPEGTLPAAFVIDNLDEGLEFVRLDLINGYRGGFPAVGFVASSRGTLSDTGLMTPTITGTGAAGDPQTLTFDLGTITNSDTDNAEPETLVIRYTVKLANIAENQGNGSALGSLRDNSAHLEWTANAATSTTATVSAGPIEVIEPDLQATHTASITTGDAFDPITYTITVSHTATSETDAFDVTIDDLIPANISVSSLVATHSTLGDVSASFAMLFSSIYTVSGQAIDLLLGETLTLVINGTLPADIQPGQTVTNNAVVSWTSLDDNAPLDGDDFTERNGLGGGVQDYAVTATAPTLTVPNATFDKTFVTTGLNSGTNSATAAVIGETVRYRLLVTLPEGTTNLAHILDTLDLGLSFDRIVSVTGYSGGAPSLDVFSSASDFTPTIIGDGIATAQQVNFNLETLSNLNSNNAQLEQFEIIYDVIVLNSAANQGADPPTMPTTLGNSAHLEWDLFGSTQSTASSDATDIEVIEPLLNVTMSLSDTTPNLGDVVTFTLTITHTADSDTEAFDIRLLDTLPTGLAIDLGSINVVGATISSDSSAGNTLDVVLDQVPHGGTVTVTFNATVTSTVSDIGLSLPNNLDMTWTSLPGTSTSERNGDAPLSIDDYADSDSTSATVVNPELSVTIDNMLTIVTPNQTLMYSIVVTNDGNSDASGITLTSTLAIDRVTFVSTDDAANVTFDSGTGLLTWTPAVGGLSPAGTLTLLLTVQVNPTVPAGADDVTVTASVTHNNIEPTPANNLASDTDTLDATPDLQLTKTDSNVSATPGTNSVYTINLSNVGNQGATNVLVTETVPIGTTFNAALSDPLWTLTAPNTYQLSLSTFAAGSSLNFSFAATVNSPATAGLNDIVNSATITDDGTNGIDPNPGDNTATDTNTLDAAPDYAITISDGKSQVRPGESLTYHVTVTNQGNQNGTGVVVSDTFPPGILQDVVASNGGIVDSLSGTITWSVGNLAVNGSITFTVTAKVRTAIDPSTRDFTHSTSVTDDLMNGLDPTPSNNLAADIDTLFFYSYDSFHNWREPQFAAFFPQASEVGRPLPPLPVDPIFSGLTEPGTTLVGRIYDSQGRVMGERQVVADSGGNWLMTFPNVLIFEHPHRMEIIVTPAISNSAHENGFNLRRYFHPAIHTELYCNEQMSVSGVFRNRAFNIIDAMHSSNTRPLGFDWFSHAYELNPASTNVANQ